MTGEYATSKAPLPDEPPAELGRCREFWAARPVLSSVAILLSPIIALIVYMSVF